VPLAVLVAVVLSGKPRGWHIARNAYIIPNIISTAAIGLIFFNLYNPNFGAVAQVIKLFTPDAQVNVLADGKLAFWGVTFAFVLFAGSIMVLVLSQIFALSQDLFEAARIDGANGRQLFFRITLPLLRPIIGTITILAANYSLLLYNEIALITRGGPDRATYSLSWFIYQTALGSTKLNFALANTAGVIQFLLGILLVAVITNLLRTNRSDI
jgi:raffinose/stachyose/melibiose transport system permease protein